ncbi:hypothetical protein G3480_09555 [Thiorhodococcus mannitoliphagus]|uniref:Uncharacterized protein n=1 Tax=Thiorhodococcus mannitoliphagus TaxID=329406 RepID=A0A6P1DTN5_9GAMM|nr:phosphatidylserine decarboxylase [Thiorhodococcus mannitoliphagus]NEX20553.1 hypothetical protein [Thiorhodococcus mannitoliphagus]
MAIKPVWRSFLLFGFLFILTASAAVARGPAQDAEQGRYVPVDSSGWPFTQTRGVVIVDTDDEGSVALIPMAMAQVSSVNFESDVRPGSAHRKGDILGNVLFGGSDFVMLFQKQVGFELRVVMPTSSWEGTLASRAVRHPDCAQVVDQALPLSLPI